VTDSTSILLDGGAIGRAVARLAHQILERDRAVEHLVLVGVRSRGVQLAHRIAHKIEELGGRIVPVGAIDITPYRDDVEEPRERIEGPETDVAFSIDDAVVVLVDDVLSTGRTVRVGEILILRIADGKIAEAWEEYDELEMRRQLGVLPS